jgi:beta-galactosidase
LNIVDAAGVRIPTATDVITSTATGPGKILAIENGDVADHEDRSGLAHRAFNGRMVLYIQSQGQSGEISLSVAARGLKTDTIRLTAD